MNGFRVRAVLIIIVHDGGVMMAQTKTRQLEIIPIIIRAGLNEMAETISQDLHSTPFAFL